MMTPARPAGETASRRLARQRQLLFVALLGLLVAATLLLNIVALQLGQRANLSYDLTANAAFRAGPETRALLAGLDRDVDIYVLASPDRFQGSPYLQQAQRMLTQYPRLSPRVRLSYVDTVTDPTFATRFPQLTLAEGNVLVASGERIKQLALAELFNYTYTPAGSLTILSSRTEEALSSAILYVTSADLVRVAALTGHGVADMATFTRLLETNNYEVARVNLITDSLDADYDLALLLAPAIDLSPEALQKLDAFLYNEGAYGKTLFITADVTQPPLPNLEAFLKEWGLVVGDGAVFETRAERTYQYQPYYPVASYVDAGYREQLKDPDAPLLMPLARPLELLFASQGLAPSMLQNEVLAQFDATAGVRPSGAGEGFTVQQASRWGPMPALVLASKRIYGAGGLTQARSNLVLSASNAMLDTFSMQNTSLANGEYLLNLLNTLCERQGVVQIAPKSLSGQTLAITTRQANMLGVLLAGVLPLAILTAGLTIWLLRRRQ